MTNLSGRITELRSSDSSSVTTRTRLRLRQESHRLPHRSCENISPTRANFRRAAGKDEVLRVDRIHDILGGEILCFQRGQIQIKIGGADCGLVLLNSMDVVEKSGHIIALSCRPEVYARHLYEALRELETKLAQLAIPTETK